MNLGAIGVFPDIEDFYTINIVDPNAMFPAFVRPFSTERPLAQLDPKIGGSSGGFDQVPPQYIRGQVLDVDGIPVSRTVFAFDRATGSRLGVAVSDETGFFTLRPRSFSPCVLVAIPQDGEQLNAVVLDNILPVAD
jgi:hypothetical protein